MKVNVISLPYIFQVLYVLCFTRPSYQVSDNRTIGPLVFCLDGDIWKQIFTEMFIELSSTFHMTFIQIDVFDWLSGRQKGSIFVKMFKNLIRRKHIEDEAETWHTCLGHYPLQKLCFLFRSNMNSVCYSNLNFQ